MKKTSFDSYIEKEIRKNPKLKDDLLKVGVAIDISMQIYRLRKEKGITQKQLAQLTGIQQSNIARLESADYEGYSLRTLNKVAEALNAKLKIYLNRAEAEEQTKEIYSYVIYYYGRPIYEIKAKLLSEEDVSTSEVIKELGKNDSYAYQ